MKLQVVFLTKEMPQLFFRFLFNTHLESRYSKMHLETFVAISLRPQRGSVKLIFTKLTNIVSLEQSHHKPMGMYGGGLPT